jgi:hypothetical protein
MFALVPGSKLAPLSVLLLFAICCRSKCCVVVGLGMLAIISCNTCTAVAMQRQCTCCS